MKYKTSTMGKVKAKEIKSKKTPAKNFPNTICFSKRGRERRTSKVFCFLSSENIRIAKAGTKITNTQGIKEKKLIKEKELTTKISLTKTKVTKMAKREATI